MALRMLRPTIKLQHSAAPRGWADPLRDSSSARGYGSAWQKLRREILERDRGLCQPCQRSGRVTLAREVDHIVNKARGGTDDPGNLQAICRVCHQQKTARESRGQ
jgi:5-methylcytosine-specific restriction protein A